MAGCAGDCDCASCTLRQVLEWDGNGGAPATSLTHPSLRPALMAVRGDRPTHWSVVKLLLFRIVQLELALRNGQTEPAMPQAIAGARDEE